MRTRPAHLTTLWLLLAMVLTSAGFATPQRNGGRSLPGVGLRTLLGRPGGNPSAMTPQQLRVGQATTAWLTSIAVPALSAPKLIPGIGGTAYVLRLFVPATGTDELFTLYVPSSPSGQARPMIVGFHGFGVSHLDFSYYNTEFLAEAAARDWFVLAPIQINPVLNTGDISFGSAESQLNVEYVLNYVLDEWPIDLDRIYGIGFSMGGGNALSYAARHRDRETGAFAAVVNHTGAVSPSDVLEPRTRDSNAPLEATFGGPPPRFEYQRAASIDLSLTDGSLLPGWPPHGRQPHRGSGPHVLLRQRPQGLPAEPVRRARPVHVRRAEPLARALRRDDLAALRRDRPPGPLLGSPDRVRGLRLARDAEPSRPSPLRGRSLRTGTGGGTGLM